MARIDRRVVLLAVVACIAGCDRPDFTVEVWARVEASDAWLSFRGERLQGSWERGFELTWTFEDFEVGRECDLLLGVHHAGGQLGEVRFEIGTCAHAVDLSLVPDLGPIVSETLDATIRADLTHYFTASVCLDAGGGSLGYIAASSN